MGPRTMPHTTGDELVDDWAEEPVTAVPADDGSVHTPAGNGVGHAEEDTTDGTAGKGDGHGATVAKRPRVVADLVTEGGGAGGDLTDAKRKRRKKDKERRRAKGEAMDRTRDAVFAMAPPKMAAFYATQLREAFSSTLSSLELEDYSLPSSSFQGPPEAFVTTEPRPLDQMEAFIQALNPKWETDYRGVNTAQPADADGNIILNKAMRKKMKKQQAETELFADPFVSQPGTPRLIVITASGIQAMNVIRNLPTLHQMCRIGKCFAKHLKVEEQEEWLHKNVVRVVAGTPNRLLKLLDMGAIVKDALTLVMIDASSRDQKNRTIFQIDEIRGDLLRLMKTHVKKTSTKISLF